MLRSLAAGIAVLLWLAGAAAQVRPVYDRGAAGLDLLLGRLQTTASALHTGGHPDDEDSALIARLARGDYARVAYLSLTRGEGGQNIIGPELFDALGVIRTEELLQARRLDGGEQFFTRAVDFGFSKSRAEAARRWGEREVLRDMVRAIRRYRPLVVASRFAGTPDDGHGHHQLAGHLTPLAVAAAADPSEFPEQLAEGLRVWQARKVYAGEGFRHGRTAPATTRINAGLVNPVLGRSYAEIAAEGRSQHKSQEMGTIEALGAQFSNLRLLHPPRAVPAGETSVFDGLDTSVAGIAALAGLPAGLLRAELGEIERAAADALRGFDARAPAAILPALTRGLRATRLLRAALPTAAAPPDARWEADFLLAWKEQDFSEAIIKAAGITVDPLAAVETVNPGGSLPVTVRGFLSDPALATVSEVRLEAPAGWTVTRVERPTEPVANWRVARETPAVSAQFVVRVPPDAPPTQPYWLTSPREDYLFDWPGGPIAGLPFAPPLIHAHVTVSIGDVSVDVRRPVRFRYADRIRGELRRDVHVVPSATVGVSQQLLVVPLENAARAYPLVVSVESHTTAPQAGTLRLELPAGWSSDPSHRLLSLAGGERLTYTFTLAPPSTLSAGTVPVRVSAELNGRRAADQLTVIAYPHIATHRLYRPAALSVAVIDVTVADVRVGYIMGSGDRVPEAIRQLGVPVTMIDAQLLASGDLSQFDTIVVGIRASEARPDFAAHHARLREFMERGGTLIVQYQQTDYARLAPLPGELGSRVTDETAPVRILEPAHPLFTFPNRISERDFDGWTQERNLYAFTTFDEGYTALLESADPGEAPQRGGALYLRVGKGHYVYTSYSWFRQLPAGVPGAYRLFANLLSLPKAPR